MKLVFLGTRAEIEPRSRRHRRHASLLVEYRRRRVMIDCGKDWTGKAGRNGATLERSFVRKRGRRLIGHAPVKTHLAWCEKVGMPEIIVTRCGSQIVVGDERRINARLRRGGLQRGVKTGIAHDGLERVLR